MNGITEFQIAWVMLYAYFFFPIVFGIGLGFLVKFFKFTL